MKRILVLALSIALLAACTGNKEVKTVEIQFPTESVALQESVATVSCQMLRPAKLYISNDKLIVFDDVKADIFKVFGLDSLNYLYAFSNMGGGPGEFQQINKENINADDSFEILYRNRLHRYSIQDSSAVELPEDSSLLVLSSVSPINNFKRLGVNQYVFNNDLPKSKKEFCLVDLQEGTQNPIGDLTEMQDEKAETLDKFYSKAICANRTRQLFAAFYYHRPAFSIYDDKGELVKEVTISSAEYPFDPSTMYFVEPYATDKHIYVMWVCMGKKQVEQDMNEFRPEILAFDWDGQCVSRMTLSKPIITFAVSEKYGKLYAVSFAENDLDKIYSFSLPKMD